MSKREWRDLSKVPEEALPPELAKDGSFVQRGGHCWVCGWRTERTGFSARQALRGHLKGHAMFRRAWERPLLIQSTCLAVAIASLALSRLGLTLPPVLSFGSLHPAAVWLGASVVGLIVVVALWATIDIRSNVTLGLVRLLVTGRHAGTLCLAGEMAWNLGLIQAPLPVLSHLEAWLAGAASLWLAAAAGIARFLKRRRKQTPEDYSLLWVAKRGGVLALEDWLDRREARRRK